MYFCHSDVVKQSLITVKFMEIINLCECRLLFVAWWHNIYESCILVCYCCFVDSWTSRCIREWCIFFPRLWNV